MLKVRSPAVAGHFYPGQPDALTRTIRDYLAEASVAVPPPKALIVPHAGYPYSGPIAASAYATLAPLRSIVTRVVLLGPAHRVLVHGLATSRAERFDTPLGSVRLDRATIDQALTWPGVVAMDEAHAHEHSLEVQLPFLQQVLADFELVPFVVGEAPRGQVADVLERLLGGPETLIVVSSDLSHYLDYATARRVDAKTTKAIEQLQPDEIGPEQACGCRAIGGLLELARRRGLIARTLDLRNSGDTAGPRDRVVGYGAYVFH
ncbi:AmmeMemoRadiSam system protein B [Thioalkalicoccus limnaeus]|uniref:MEMO1 family protein ABC977_06935 n=1 Tax=Thioalkalicoccus limnaeus TaxID=120681 RepID=A0ABV4BCB4_9GAMM